MFATFLNQPKQNSYFAAHTQSDLQFYLKQKQQIERTENIEYADACRSSPLVPSLPIDYR